MRHRTAEDAIASVHLLSLDLLGAADEARHRARSLQKDECGSMRATSGHYLITAFKMDALYRAIGDAMDAGLETLLHQLYARRSIDGQDEIIDAGAIDEPVPGDDGSKLGGKVNTLHLRSPDRGV